MDFAEQLRQTKQEVLDAQKQKVHTESGFPTTIESIFKDACYTSDMSDDEFIKNAILTHYRTLLEDGQLAPDATSFDFSFSIKINGSLLQVEKEDSTEEFFTVESIALATRTREYAFSTTVCNDKDIEPFRVKLNTNSIENFMENELPKFSEIVFNRLNECGIKVLPISNADYVQIVYNSSYRLIVHFRCLL